MLINFVNSRFENNVEEFRKKVKQCVKDSLDHVYDSPETDDAHYLKFSPWDPEIHEPIRQKLYESRVIHLYNL